LSIILFRLTAETHTMFASDIDRNNDKHYGCYPIVDESIFQSERVGLAVGGICSFTNLEGDKEMGLFGIILGLIAIAGMLLIIAIELSGICKALKKD